MTPQLNCTLYDPKCIEQATLGPGWMDFCCFIAYQMPVLFIPQQASIDLQSSEARERKEGEGSRVCGSEVVEPLGRQSVTNYIG